MTQQPGTYRIIRVDGSEEVIPLKPTIRSIQARIGCSCCDTVCLSKSADGQAETVMMVDDTGMVDGKPINPKATALYHQVRLTPYSIHGDVAIVNDGDFA